VERSHRPDRREDDDGKLPVKIQVGVEYSVVSQDDFGQRAQIKLDVIPVIPALFSNPFFGGD
jgi:hypothetical protein